MDIGKRKKFQKMEILEIIFNVSLITELRILLDHI